jgi:hypothetical protein
MSGTKLMNRRGGGLAALLADQSPTLQMPYSNQFMTFVEPIY